MRVLIAQRRRFATRALLGVGACIALAFSAQSANAATLVVPNSDASTSGNSTQRGILDTGSVTFQFEYSANQFSALTPGEQITGIGFRLPAGASTFNTALVYSLFSIQIGQATAAPGSLSNTFATNEAADTVTALSGPLTIAAGSFVGGAGTNPFFELAFTTPYTYTGGDLLVTLRHSDPGFAIDVDANSVSSLPGVTDTIADFGDANATTGSNGEGFFNSPVTAFFFSPANTSAVPEPATLTLLGIGMAGMAGYRGWRRRKQPGAC